jgi:hypothetical protein
MLSLSILPFGHSFLIQSVHLLSILLLFNHPNMLNGWFSVPKRVS